MIGAAVHALGKALLFASVAAPEAEGAPMLDARALASRHPLSCVGFLCGALAVLGVPPTLGFAAHWRIFLAAGNHRPLLIVLAVAAMLSVAVYARAIALFWYGPDEDSSEKPIAYNRPVFAAAIIILCLALLAAGLWPQLLGVA
jgi:multicomponent Na+:H+ antiporter subunit D